MLVTEYGTALYLALCQRRNCENRPIAIVGEDMGNNYYGAFVSRCSCIDVDVSDFFKLRCDDRNRGHQYKLFLPGYRSSVRQQFLSYRAVHTLSRRIVPRTVLFLFSGSSGPETVMKRSRRELKRYRMNECVFFVVDPNGHTTLLRRRYNVDTTSRRDIDVVSTSKQRSVPIGMPCELFFLMIRNLFCYE